MSDKPLVCVDFDRTLNTYKSGWDGYEPSDPPFPGALKFIEALQGIAEVVIFTGRADTVEGTEGVERWLKKNGFPALRVTNVKPPKAVAYVDDRAVPFKGSYKDCMAEVMSLIGKAKKASA